MRASVMRLGESNVQFLCLRYASALPMASLSLKRVPLAQGILREARISTRFAHPNILPTLGTARIKNSLAIISPWMRNGNISEYLNRHPTADRLRLVNLPVQRIHSSGLH